MTEAEVCKQTLSLWRGTASDDGTLESFYLKSQAVVSSAPPPRAFPSTKATEMRGNLYYEIHVSLDILHVNLDTLQFIVIEKPQANLRSRVRVFCMNIHIFMPSCKKR